jgi:hypothetical protein
MKKIKDDICGIIILLGFVAAAIGFIDLVRFPDYYITGLKESLKYELRAGNEDAIQYYETRYVERGRELFKEGEI